jgi:hypothetical protein
MCGVPEANMKALSTGSFALLWSVTLCSAQATFNSYEEYCKAVSEVATPTLMARITGVSKAQAGEGLKSMTDPAAIRMVRETLDFAYSKPPSMGIDAMRSELNRLCLQRKIFVQ